MAENTKQCNNVILYDLQSFVAVPTYNLEIIKRKHIVNLVWSGCQLLFFKDEHLQNIHRFENTVADVETDGSNVYVLLQNGCIYKIQMPSFKKSKKKKKHGEKPPTSSSGDLNQQILLSHITCDIRLRKNPITVYNIKKKHVEKPTTTSGGDLNQQIFAGLLPESEASQEPVEHQAGYEITDISPEQSLIQIHNACQFSVVKQTGITLFTLRKLETVYVAFYNTEKLFLNSEESQEMKDVQEPIAESVIPFTFNIKCESQSSVMYNTLKGFQKEIPVSINTKICICYKRDDNNPTTGMESKHCVIGECLFEELFGKAATLLGNPVILLALPNGHVHIISSSNNTSSNILYDLREPVCDFNTMSLATGDEYESLEPAASSKSYQCFVIIGVYGKVVFLYLGKSGKLVTEERLLPSPVYCSYVINNMILNSTLLGLFYSKCWLGENGKLKQISAEAAGFHNAIHISGLSATQAGVESSLHTVQLLAVTHFGKVYKLVLNTDVRSQSALHRQPGGHQIGDLLTSISNLSIQHEKLHSQMSKQDQTIEQLALASIIASGYSSNHINSEHEKLPITIEGYVEKRDFGVYTVIVKLQPNSVNFTGHWSVLVNVTPICDNNKVSGSEFGFLNSKCVKFVNKLKGQCQEVRLDVPCDIMLKITPFVVRVSLILVISSSETDERHHRKSSSFDDSLSSDAYTQKTCGKSAECDSINQLTIPCYSTNIDILHVLRPSSNADTPDIGNNNYSKSASATPLEMAIENIAKERPCVSFYDDIQNGDPQAGAPESVQLTEVCSCTVAVPSVVVRDIIRSSQEKGIKPESVLLKLIFDGNSAMLLACRRQVHVKTVSPSNSQILLSVICTESVDRHACMEVYIQAYHVSELCAVRQAIIHRLQAKYQDGLVTDESTSCMTQHLRKYIRQVEEVQSEAEALENLEDGITTSDKVKKTVQLYSKLRNISTKEWS